jgi:chorismate mutase-like protein
MSARGKTILCLGLAVVLTASTRAAAADLQPLLRVGTSGDYAPFSLRGRGFDVDVSRALAADLGLTIEWVPFRWPELGQMVSADRMDVAMGGITWRPERAVIGWMSRTVAWGGPCVVGDSTAGLIAVNRGGVLEAWARNRFAGWRIVPFDDNLALPALLAGGAVAAFVTDSFEVSSRPVVRGAAVRCDPLRDRKVYWIAPARAADLGPRIDGWLAANESRVAELRRRWWGDARTHDDVDDLVDRIARRLELMPEVAAWKRAHARPIDDLDREARVLERVEARAQAAGLEPSGVVRIFELQIDLAKAIERRAAADTPHVDLEGELRPLLLRIGDEIVAGLAAVAPIEPGALDEDRLVPLGALLTKDEVARLKEALIAVGRKER